MKEQLFNTSKTLVKKNRNKITIEENFKKLGFFFKEFFNNIYEYYTKGIGYNISKFQKKTKYRLQNSLKLTKEILEKENVEKIKKEFMLYYVLLEKEKKKESLKNTDWLQAEVIINSCVLQNIYIKEILEQITETNIDIEKIEKKVFDQLKEARWDYEKTSGKKFSHRKFSCLEKAITGTKRKKKMMKKSKNIII